MIPLMSVWRNFVLGAEPEEGWGPLRRMDVGSCLRAARDELERLGVEIRDLSQPVGTLSGGSVRPWRSPVPFTTAQGC